MVMGTTDVALRLGCSPENVRALERAGKLPCERTPSGRRVFRTEDVERLAIERERQRQEKATRTTSAVEAKLPK